MFYMERDLVDDFAVKLELNDRTEILKDLELLACWSLNGK
jgi:hypothetical protein